MWFFCKKKKKKETLGNFESEDLLSDDKMFAGTNISSRVRSGTCGVQSQCILFPLSYSHVCRIQSQFLLQKKTIQPYNLWSKERRYFQTGHS